MGVAEITITIIGYIISIGLFIKGKIDKRKAKEKEQYTDSIEYENTKLSILAKVPEFCDEAERVVGKGNGPIKELYVTCKIDKLAHEKSVVITQEEIKVAIENTLTAPQKKK